MRKELIIVLFLQCEHKSEVYLDTKVVETYIHVCKTYNIGVLFMVSFYINNFQAHVFTC